MNVKSWSILNVFSVIGVIIVNYASMVFRWNDSSISEMSNSNPNLFTPAGYAFSIWGIIFLGMIILSVSLALKANRKKRNDKIRTSLGWSFILANICNALWVVNFIYGYFFLSVLIMLGILFFLHRVLYRLVHAGPLISWERNTVLIPICLYAGWISVATIANTAFVLSSTGWTGTPLSDVHWTLALIVVAFLLHLFMVLRFNLKSYSIVGVWALVAIAVRHQGAIHSLFIVSAIAAAVLLLTILYQGISRKTIRS